MYLGGIYLGYRNVNEILPDELIELIQNYIDGENIYIPRKNENRKCWGDDTITKRFIHARNTEIYQKYQNGYRVIDLADEYHISTQGIYKILSKQKE
jgi:Mor family transcriptional regulator